MIDCFIVGDYSCLRNTNEGTPRRNNQGSTPLVIDPSQRATASSRTSLQSSVLISGRHRQSSLRSQARTSEVEESYVPPRTRRLDRSAVAPSNRRTEVSGGTIHQPVRGQLVRDAPGYYGDMIPESVNGVDLGSVIPQDFITDSLGGKY